MTSDDLTPEWIKDLELEHTVVTTTTLVTLEEIDYALGVVGNQVKIVLKMFDDLRRQMLTREQEKGDNE